MDKEMPVRKKIRLEGYDYSKNGAYYVTFCVENRYEILGKIVGSGFHARPSVELSDIGIETQKSIEYICENDERIEIPKYVIMPLKDSQTLECMNWQSNSSQRAISRPGFLCL